MKARSAAREVIATYSVDDIFIELVIQLPQNHPLGSITVESGQRVGVAVQQWRNWMLQLSTYLTHQVEIQTHFWRCLCFKKYLESLEENHISAGVKEAERAGKRFWGSVMKRCICALFIEWQHNGGSGSVEEQRG